MAIKSTETFAEAIGRLLSINLNTKFAVRRCYDDWAWKQIFADRKRKLLIKAQKLNVDMHSKFGSDLATSKFVIGILRGAVRDERGIWIKREADLPPDYCKNFRVTAISATRTNLMTEGVDNFVGLDCLESLDLSRNEQLDDFACDQLSRQFRKSKTLRQINLSFNPLITVYGLEILFRIPSVRQIVAIETQASKYEDIDLFVLSAEDERQCQVLVHEGESKAFSVKGVQNVFTHAAKRTLHFYRPEAF